MTAPDWEKCPDPGPMLEVVYPVRSADTAEPQSRRSRLYLLACGRAAWGKLPGACRAVVAAGERVYLRGAGDEFRRAVRGCAEELTGCRGVAGAVNAVARKLVRLRLSDRLCEVVATADVPPAEWAGYAYLAYLPFCPADPDVRRVPADLHSADLLREVFGNPKVVRPPLRREWLTSTVVGLARHAADGPDLNVLPVLADALDDAGCDRDDLLRHLRDPGRGHVRGCWALEDVLAAAPPA